jgi:hypothetical protein
VKKALKQSSSLSRHASLENQHIAAGIEDPLLLVITLSDHFSPSIAIIMKNPGPQAQG